MCNEPVRRETGMIEHFNNMLSEIQASSKSILVLGEQLIDRWHFGHFLRQNPESPGTQVFVVEKTVEMPGGAASFKKSLTAFNLQVDSIFSNSSAATKERWALSRSGQLVFRVDRDLELGYDQGELSIDVICKECKDHDLIVLCDYGKGFFCYELFSMLQSTDALGEKKVVFSPHARTMRELSSMASIIRYDRWVWVLNELEASLRQLDPRLLVITRGHQPILVEELGEKSVIELPSNAPCPVHTCAVGDMFLAGFCAALVNGPTSLADCAWFAMQCCQRALLNNRLGTHYLMPEDFKT
jgi:bifunctional ADP-heptose synthase (sugar kinase/adenylyltransferase)